MNKRLPVLLTTAALMLLGSVGAMAMSPAQAPSQAPVGLSILCPSTGNDTISAGRDFYVTGAITGKVPEGSRLSVSLLSDKQADRLVREVYTNIKDNREGLLIGDGYSHDDYAMLAGSGMPDLVYDPKIPESFYDAWRKCYYDDSSFSALITGGRYRTDNIRMVDETGRVYLPLGAGEYTLEVAVVNNGETLAKVTRRITLGVTPNKVISAEAPEAHSERIAAEALRAHYALYTDPLPGRWLINMPLDSEVDDTVYELPYKWKQALRAEYSQGRSHLYVYNLAAEDPANTVALGLLQQQNVIDVPDRLRCYYYDIGEPSLSYLPHRISELVAFGAREKMVLTRAESSSLSAGDNRYDPTAPFHGMVDFLVRDGIDVNPGETLSLFGATAPIQNRSYDLVEQSDHSVTVGNRIASVRYTIEGAGVSLQLEKPVELTRLLDGAESTSIYEFRHTFSVGADWSGKLLKVRAQGVDARGRDIEQALTRFELRVAATLVNEAEQSGEGVREASPFEDLAPDGAPLGQGGVIRDI